MRHRVGATISMANLARDLQKDATTVKRWLSLLESLYIIFKVTPYHHKVSRSLLKEPKYYFYDWAQIDNEGIRLENLVACALHFLRTKDGKEIDFLVLQGSHPTHLIEVKTSNDGLSPHFALFSPLFPKAEAMQLVRDLKRQKTYPNGSAVLHLPTWLVKLF